MSIIRFDECYPDSESGEENIRKGFLNFLQGIWAQKTMNAVGFKVYVRLCSQEDSFVAQAGLL